MEYRLLRRAVCQRHGVLARRQEVVSRVVIEDSQEPFRVVLELAWSSDREVKLLSTHADGHGELCSKVFIQGWYIQEENEDEFAFS